MYNRSYEKTEAAVARAQKEGAWQRRSALPDCPAGPDASAAAFAVAGCCAGGSAGGRPAGWLPSQHVLFAALLPCRQRHAGSIQARAACAPVTYICLLLTHHPGVGSLLHGYKDLKDFVLSLERPRCVELRSSKQNQNKGGGGENKQGGRGTTVLCR